MQSLVISLRTQDPIIQLLPKHPPLEIPKGLDLTMVETEFIASYFPLNRLDISTLLASIALLSTSFKANCNYSL